MRYVDTGASESFIITFDTLLIEHVYFVISGKYIANNKTHANIKIKKDVKINIKTTFKVKRQACTNIQIVDITKTNVGSILQNTFFKPHSNVSCYNHMLRFALGKEVE